MSAEIIMFVPRPNPKREETEPTMNVPNFWFGPKTLEVLTDCGNAIWPWPEKDGA